MTTVAVLGSITRDRIIITKQNLDYNQPGGGVYYSSHTLASLGVQVIAMPLLSSKDKELLAALQRERIESIPQWMEETTCYQNTYPGDSFDTCEKKILKMAEGFSPSNNFFKMLDRVDAIHLVPLSSQEFEPALFRKLRKVFKKTISLDGQGFTKGPHLDIGALIGGNIDIIKLDDAEFHAELFANLARWGIPEVLITKASQGSTLYFKNRAHLIPAYPPQKMVDATGCGDAFIAGYLTKRLEGQDPVQAAHFASKIGAKNLEVKGALVGDLH